LDLPLPGLDEFLVIEDGIVVAKELGGHYLWVDKFCIDQRNSREKHEQISRLDQIYEKPSATIIAAGSQSPDPGLSGVRSVPRQSQPFAYAGQYVVSSFPSLNRLLARPPWLTRAWTYQEALFSRICFYLTDLQVYFVCGEMSCCEAVISGFIKSKEIFPKIVSTQDPDMWITGARRTNSETSGVTSSSIL